MNVQIKIYLSTDKKSYFSNLIVECLECAPSSLSIGGMGNCFFVVLTLSLELAQTIPHSSYLLEEAPPSSNRFHFEEFWLGQPDFVKAVRLKWGSVATSPSSAGVNLRQAHRKYGVAVGDDLREVSKAYHNSHPSVVKPTELAATSNVWI